MNKTRIPALVVLVGTAAFASASPMGLNTDNGNLWLGTGVSYEVLQNMNQQTVEFGYFGFAGFGAGYNVYLTGGKQSGLVASARLGVMDFSFNDNDWFNQLTNNDGCQNFNAPTDIAAAGNLLVSFVGDLGSSFRLRIGAGLGYVNERTEGIFGATNGLYPVAELTLGYRF